MKKTEIIDVCLGGKEKLEFYMDVLVDEHL